MRILVFKGLDDAVHLGEIDALGIVHGLKHDGRIEQDGVLVALDAQGRQRPLARTGTTTKLAEVTLLAPVPRPHRNIFCVGKNYHEHVKEFANSGYDSSATSDAPPESPIVFSKLPQSVIATKAEILQDRAVSTDTDYEAELGVIIGTGGRNISSSDAMSHVWAYTIINDVTARDVQKNHKQWLLGKSQDTFCPMGPWVVTRDEIDLANTRIQCWVNEELRQNATTDMMIFDVPTLIATISHGITLLPGDIIATGTPSGVGIGFKPPRWLRPGDRVKIEISGIGVLENAIAAR
ncbi:MAG: FAA hydrolase family protein [Gammaproteobacteria bacterium]|nr:FAA hydrolase family protein [Gammaproteobacteria bacterium]